MQKFIFKKDGEDNQTIIEKITNFIKRNWEERGGTHGGIELRLSDNSAIFPCWTMLHKDAISYVLAEVFNEEGFYCNYILQFITGKNLTLCHEESIWIGNDTEVIFDDENITLKRTGGPIQIRKFAWAS